MSFVRTWCCPAFCCLLCTYMAFQIAVFFLSFIFGWNSSTKPEVSPVLEEGDEQSYMSLNSIRQSQTVSLVGSVLSYLWPYIWQFLIYAFVVLKYVVYIALNCFSVVVVYYQIERSRRDQTRVIKINTAKVTKKEIFFSQYFAGLLAFYSFVIIDLLLLYSGFLGSNLRTITIFQKQN